MSNMHLISMDGTEFSAAFHVGIPATNNLAGCPWRTIVLRFGGGVTSLPSGDGTLGTISAAETALIVAGAVVEVVTSGRWNDGFPTGAQLDVIANRVANEYLSVMQLRYSRYGMTR